jgi:hypothetical protein
MNTTILATTADVRASFEEKVKSGLFAPVARHLRDDLVEDRMAEGLGLVYVQFARSVTKGEPMTDALLVQACHMRAIDLSRRLAGAGGSQPKRDVMDERNYKSGKVEVLRLDGQSGNDEENEGYVLALAEGDVGHPARWLHSALDLQTWLSRLPAADRLLLGLRRAGHTLEEIAAKTGMCITAILKRLKELGRELAERAGLEWKTRVT